MSKGLYWSQLLLGIGVGFIIASSVWILLPEEEQLTREIIYYNSSDLSLGHRRLTLPGEEVFSPAENSVTGASLEVTKGLQIGLLLAEGSSQIGKTQEQLAEIEIFIQPGETAADIAQKLLEKGIIKEDEEFLQIVREKRLDRKLRAGSYLITVDTDLDDFIEKLIR